MPPARPETVEALLRELGPRLRRAEAPREAPARCPTGLASLDVLLGGGLPRGRLAEIGGPPSSGRTALALHLLAKTTRAGESAAWVDAPDAFDPASAASAGADLERILWVRCPDRPLRAAEILLRAGGFALVAIDLARQGIPPRSPAPTAAWLRLVRAAAASGTTLVVLSAEIRLAGSHAEVALVMKPIRPRFAGAPLELEALEVEAALVRNRGGPPEGRARLLLVAPW